MTDKTENELIAVTGTVIEIIYTNEDNGYTVCEITSKAEGAFVATGYMPYVNEGENIEAKGKWVVHPEYGEQFSVVDYKTVLPQISLQFCSISHQELFRVFVRQRQKR